MWREILPILTYKSFIPVNINALICAVLLTAFSFGCSKHDGEDSPTFIVEKCNFVGDSHVELWHLGRSFPGLSVVNYGVSGSGLDYLKKCEGLSQDEPVVVVSGGNDLYKLYTDNAIEEYSLDFLDAVDKLGGSITYVVSLLPRNIIGKPIDMAYSSNRKASQLNALLIREIEDRKEKYADESRIIEFIDVYDSFLGNEEDIIDYSLFLDGLHLNDNGYEVLTNHLLSYLMASDD